MADEMTNWPVEPIPNEDYLFLRVHRDHTDDQGEPIPYAFVNRPKGSPGMSVDWSLYCTSAETRARGPKSADHYAIVKFTGFSARAIPNQSVTHDPVLEPPNRAHSQVFGIPKYARGS